MKSVPKYIGRRQFASTALLFEKLESRELLTIANSSIELSPHSAWFATRSATNSTLLGDAKNLGQVGSKLDISQPVESEWIVQLTPDASVDPSFDRLKQLFDATGVDFEIVRGLGIPGLIQVRAHSQSVSTANESLAANSNIASFFENTLVSGATIPNDSDFGSLVGLNNVGQFNATPDADIDAVEAWDETTGSPSTIVAVIDSGIDATHPDLYLNIWINQGEIPKPLSPKLNDVDHDQLITFYDLNAPSNSSLVRDSNGNTYIDANDLLLDPIWADGIDTDRNGFIDDFFGWNFRTGLGEAFPPNNPSDALGHGTHVAGTIGAIGNNSLGVTGVNWKTSLMSLKFLDQNNQGDIASAIAAFNYATMMRTQFSTNVRVINSSWGQSGSPNAILGRSIESAGEAGILVVAAAGNGNVLGLGNDNSRTPFYPASYDLENIISVGASDNFDHLAPFSNFGDSSVDIVAPGVGVRSTLPGGRFGDANGTSMAAPLVSGTAALIWTELPNASIDEVRRAILESADEKADLNGKIASKGRLNAFDALQSNVFAPIAELVAVNNVSASGATSHEVTVRYRDKQGLDVASLNDDDLSIRHGWGASETLTATLKAGSIRVEDDGKSIVATYLLTPPGGSWDPLDFGQYAISTVAGSVFSASQRIAIRSQNIGNFNVKILGPSILYVETFSDSTATGSLRNAIDVANSEPGKSHTIILESGRYTIDIPRQSDQNSSFASSEIQSTCLPSAPTPLWSNASTGDFDVLGDLHIVGDSNIATIIDARGLDRVFRVHPKATLSLERVMITGGVSEVDQGGGGVLSAGTLNLKQVVVKDNRSPGSTNVQSRGGGIASWGGTLNISQSRITKNQSDIGAGIFLCGPATTNVNQSTIDNNQGGGILSHSSEDTTVTNTTVAANIGGAIQSQSRDYPGGNNSSFASSVSRNGKFVTFLSDANNLTAKDTNAATDVFVVDVASGSVVRASVSSANQQANRASESAVISGDGSKVVFLSDANNLVQGDSLLSKDLFARELANGTTTLLNSTESSSREIRGIPGINDNGNRIAYQQSVVDDPTNGWGVYIANIDLGTRERVELSLSGTEVYIGFLDSSILSGDGRFLALASRVTGTADENFHNIYLYDTTSKTLSLPQLRKPTTAMDGSNYAPALSYDGRFMAFESDDTQLVTDDSNHHSDIFIFDQLTAQVFRASQSSQGIQPNGDSSSPSISSDGRFVTFSSFASNLVANDKNNQSDIFVADLTTGNVDRVSLASDGTEANGHSFFPAISGDGRFVTFESVANNLDNSPPAHRLPVSSTNRQIFVFDRQTRTIKSISSFTQSSTVHVADSTVVFNTGSETLSGNVTSSNSLYASNNVQFDFGSRVASAGYNILASAAGTVALSGSDRLIRDSTNLLGPLTKNGNLPPGYRLLFGNPAIAGGSSQVVGTLDQWNQLRVFPDVGALAAVSGSASGLVYADLNANNIRDTNEPGLPNLSVFLDSNRDGIEQTAERSVQSASGATNSGSFSFQDIIAGDQSLRVVVPKDWEASGSPIVRAGIGSVQPNGDSTRSVVSSNGRTVAFLSTASNLVSGDNSQPNIFVYSRDLQKIEKIPFDDAGLSPLQILGDQDQLVLFRSDSGVFLYDRQKRTTEAVSISSSGELGNAHSDSASSSFDGNWIAFSSFANNLVPNDNDNFADIFLLNRTTRTVTSITRDATGVQGNNDSENPSISRDGRYITFVSDASNLVAEDKNSFVDVFVYDRFNHSIKRVNVSETGSESNGFTFSPTISGNGKYVVFQSLATNLVADDTNGTSDLFVVDITSSKVERLSIPFEATSLSINYSPTISEDGQYVVFSALNSILTPTDTSTDPSVFVYDRFTDQSSRIALVSKAVENRSSNGASVRAKISRDNKSIVFESSASNLVLNDTNQRSDVFIAQNPFETASRNLTIKPGQQLTAIEIGLVPSPGTISGTVFQDLNSDAVYDIGDPVLVDWTVFLDQNKNGRRDADELATLTREDGSYSFTAIPSYREYTVAVEAPIGWVLTTRQSDSDSRSLFLPAGGNAAQGDFAYQLQSTTGQSENANVEGRVYVDFDGDGKQQPDEPGRSGVEVYLDLNGNERRDFDEPRNVTDSMGKYVFTNLGNRSYTIRTVLAEGVHLTSPIGNKFATNSKTFSTGSTILSRPQDIAIADLDGINGPDLAVALYSGNSISIQLNDGRGNFTSAPINVNVTPNGQGPIALVAGNLNSSGQTDLVVANAANSTFTVFLDFSRTTFTQSFTYTVGAIPSAIVLADFDADSDLDVLISAMSDAQAGQLKIFLNNGKGQFTSSSSIPTGGKRPVGAVAGDFNNDLLLDIAVVNEGDFGKAGDNGNVSILLGRRRGGFESPKTYIVGNTPVSIAAADLNGDGTGDLVVSNFFSNTASILLGGIDGTFKVQPDQLSVGRGPVQVSLIDIDNDLDRDILVSNLSSKSVSILRNRLSQQSSGAASFEPAETFGVGAFSIGPRQVFAAADLDTSGSTDLALIDSESNSITILRNDLVDGANRLQLSGTGTTVGQNFGTRSLILKPTLDPLAGPDEILEDAALRTVAMSGISRGRTSGPPLRIAATSSNPNIVPNPTVAYAEGASTGRIEFAPAKDAQGFVTILVQVRDAGADAVFDTPDDGIVERSLALTVRPVNDAPSVTLRGNQFVTQGSNARIVNQFASDFRTGGGPDEQTQTIAEYITSNDRTDLFLIQPSIDNQGNLRFQPAVNVTGTATISVQIRDSGGTEVGGVDRSPIQTFIISILGGTLDFGDAPSADQTSYALSYPTLLLDNGARHAIGELFLGATIDSESNGQVNRDALGDDSVQDDEDGIVFPVTAFTSSVTPSMASFIATASVASKLDAWIDFNQDGDWNDSGEQIASSAAMNPGRNIVSFTVPAGARVGTTYSRFRISSTGGLSVTGLAEDGEVEDHAIQILDQLSGVVTLQAFELGIHEVLLQDGSLVIRAGGKPVFSAPATLIRQLKGVSSLGLQVYQVGNPAINLFGTIHYAGPGQSVVMSTSQSQVNLSTLEAGSIAGIQVVDLSSAVVQSLQFNAANIASINSDSTLKVILGSTDRIQTNSVWTLQSRANEQGELVHFFEKDSAILKVQSPRLWQNQFVTADVSGDGSLSPIDALLVINYLNLGARTLPDFDPLAPLRNSFVDVDGNGEVSPLDALLVINALNARPSSGGEGELDAATTADALIQGGLVTRTKQVAVDSSQLLASDVVDCIMQEFYPDASNGNVSSRRRFIPINSGRIQRKI